MLADVADRDLIVLADLARGRCKQPPSSRSSVVLPEPFEPIRATAAPESNLIESMSSTCRLPKDTLTSLSVNIAASYLTLHLLAHPVTGLKMRMSLTIVTAVHESLSTFIRSRRQVLPSLCPRESGRGRRRQRARLAALIGAGVLLAAACASDDATDAGADDGTPKVVASMSIWADVVENVTCNGLVQVESLAPPGVDTHTYEPSPARSRQDG